MSTLAHNKYVCILANDKNGVLVNIFVNLTILKFILDNKVEQGQAVSTIINLQNTHRSTKAVFVSV